jgi:hypothetical protein
MDDADLVYVATQKRCKGTTWYSVQEDKCLSKDLDDN